MPPIFRFYLGQCLIGFVVAGAFVAAILYFNVANLWHLISTSDIGLMAVIVFWVLNGIVFAGVQTGIAVMMMAEKDDVGDDDDDMPGGGEMQPLLVPIQKNP